MKTLTEVTAEKPFPEYRDWWPVGSRFLAWMQQAVTPAWHAATGGSLAEVRLDYTHYLETVYGRQPEDSVIDAFAGGSPGLSVRSGEFDALSYAFFRSAFLHLDAAGRRDFTRLVGRTFFDRLAAELVLDIPTKLEHADDFTRMQTALRRTGAFLVGEGYLRDHFAFSFDIETRRAGRPIRQREEEFIDRLHRNPPAYARYEMGYPAILPSAVYLYNTIGEAQHHSSRTIEELFARAGCSARETADFDPSEHPPELVVEWWEIRPDGNGR